MNSEIKTKGEIEAIITYANGTKEERHIYNTVLQTGRSALASSLANNFGGDYQFFLQNMLFGDGGADNNGNPKYVDSSRTGLFGTTLINKSVSSTVDSLRSNEVVATTILTFSDLTSPTPISEMALVMGNGQVYSMATFPTISKTSLMQIVWNWRISFI